MNYMNYNGLLYMKALLSDGADDLIVYVDNSTENLITSILVEYALGNSETTAPTSGWSTTAPPHEDGKYMWQRTTTTKKSGAVSSSVTCIQGADGGGGIDYEEDEPISPRPNGLWVKTSTGNIYLWDADANVWIPLTEEYATVGDVNSNIANKKYETFYAYADGPEGENFSLTASELEYRGIYTTASGIQSNDPQDYKWELNPMWASKVASDYIAEQTGGLKILTPDAKTYAGITGLALAFYTGDIEQARMGYLYEEENKTAYGVIAQNIFAYGSGAGVKFDNSNEASVRGRFTWEIRDNGHLSLKKY